MSLIVEVRPTSLDGVFGNAETLSSLQALLARSNLEAVPHAFLFHGPPGCGKTTLARIMARELGCFDTNIVEINAGNLRGIDMVRETICSHMSIPPFGGIMAYIIDESHALTKQAMECLLKPVEDAPSWCYFFFCTTDLSKVLPAIRNRCSAYTVSPINDDEMIELVLFVMETKGIRVEDSVISAIVKAAAGCPREGLKFLEQANGMEPAVATRFLATVEGEETECIDICRLLVTPVFGHNNEIMARFVSCRTSYEGIKNKDPEALRRSILGYMKACLLRTTRIEEASRYVKIIETFACVNLLFGGEPAFIAALFKACSL